MTQILNHQYSNASESDAHAVKMKGTKDQRKNINFKSRSMGFLVHGNFCHIVKMVLEYDPITLT